MKLPSQRYKDITGQTFYALKAVKYVRTEFDAAYWTFRCSCGSLTIKRASSVRRGSTKSCGCLKTGPKESHGMSGLKIHQIWTSMKNRCSNPNHKLYKNYGGRGVKVCKRWLSFEPFFSDMGHKPKGKSLDRIDNNGDYSPENCRWADSEIQQNNKTTSRLLTIKGETKTISQWARLYDKTCSCIAHRLKIGWPIEKAIIHPSIKSKSR